jgi:hypothetical protein
MGILLGCSLQIDLTGEIELKIEVEIEVEAE